MARQATILLMLVLCSGLVSARNSKQPSDANNFCQGCRALVAFSQTFNQSNNRSDYKDIFKNFCEFYYPVSTDFQQGPCPLFVEGLYTLIDHIDPVHHCDQIGACGSTLNVEYTLSPLITKMPPKQADVICKFCEQSLEQVQTALLDPKTIDQIRRQVDQLCDYLKVMDVDKECHQLGSKYLNQAIEFIKKIDPMAYCRSIQLCPAQASAISKGAKKIGASLSRKQQAPSLADFNNFGIETSVMIGERSSAKELQQTQSVSPNCYICKTMIKEMFKFLRDNKTEANIMEGLDRVCLLLFKGEHLDKCQSMVNAYTKELIQLLMDETDPGMICTLLEQCLGRRDDSLPLSKSLSRSSSSSSESEQTQYDLGDLIHSLDPTVKIKSAKVCFECKMFIKYLQTVIDEPKSRDSIRKWLQENLCKSIADNETRVECTHLVDRYADTFLAALLGSLKPAAACSDLGACNQRTLSQVLHIDTLAPFDKPDELPSFIISPKPPQQQQHQVVPKALTTSKEQSKAIKGQLCDQCVQIVTQIDEYLSKHPIDNDVSVLIDQVCNKMPQGTARAECITLIEAFGSDIAQAIATMDNPRQLCSTIMLC